MRFQRRIGLLGRLFRLNLSKEGASVSAGPRGLTTNISKQGVRQTIGLPGTGLSWSREIGAGETEGAVTKRLIEREVPRIMQEAAEERRLQKAFEENADDLRATILRAGGKRMQELIDAIDSNTSSA